MKRYSVLFLLWSPLWAFGAPVDYLREIKPVLAARCYGCHGGKKQRGGLRLDTAKAALKGSNSGAVIVPGKSSRSILLKAVRGGTDEIKAMPPRDPKLSPKEVALLARWIDEGAIAPDSEVGDRTVAKSDHWSFQAIQRASLPSVKDRQWARNGIDRFILARLEKEGIRPSLEADRATLIRRLSLDLTGLPPSSEAVMAFLSDPRPDAYEHLVERLLASPHYGERWGRHWLDLARYADSNGFTIDGARTIWPYRDWVIEAINRDLPFDQFTIHQIAGDMLPKPTREQLVATGFHRNTLFNQEGGIDREQFRVEFTVDRVNTTGSVFLGLTIGCAQCHDHKFDPVSQREFYELFAFFNSVDEPQIKLPTPLQQRKQTMIQKEISTLDQLRKQLDKTSAKGQQIWEQNLTAKAKAELSKAVQEAFRFAPNSRSRKQRDLLAKVYRDGDLIKHIVGGLGTGGALPPLPHWSMLLFRTSVNQKIASLKKSLPSIPTTMVMRERRSPRITHVHIKGDFTRKGAVVAPGTPGVLPPLSKRKGANRLDLAKWLVDRKNPLTARVVVNRFWQRYFGLGLVETENDFGTQGTRPSHSELLDWLADEFMAQGWSMKKMHRLIVTSATYRQSSHARPDILQDQGNRLLARQARLRLDAEIVRDNALAVSGLLTKKIGGPSVFPPQPEGVYAFTQVKKNWRASQGADRYRRGMYTYFWRSAPHPGLMAFDAPDSNTTCTRRNRSNTPIQALTLLNDQTFVECARALALRGMREVPEDAGLRLAHLFQVCLARKPYAREQERLMRFVELQRKAFRSAPREAADVIGNAPRDLPTEELAVWTMVARVLLNLDELITRE